MMLNMIEETAKITKSVKLAAELLKTEIEVYNIEEADSYSDDEVYLNVRINGFEFVIARHPFIVKRRTLRGTFNNTMTGWSVNVCDDEGEEIKTEIEDITLLEVALAKAYFFTLQTMFDYKLQAEAEYESYQESLRYTTKV